MFKPNSISFTLLLAGLCAMPPLSIDMGLPAYEATARSLGTSQATISLTVSLFMIGFAAGPLVYGPLSERFGRRIVVLCSLALYSATSLACLVTPSAHLLLSARLVQGFAASSGMALTIAMVRDLFEGAAAQRKISLIMLIQSVMPMIAPTIGGFVLSLTGWRGIYGVMLTVGVALLLCVWCLDETIRQKTPDALRPMRLWQNYRTVARHPIAGRHILLASICAGVLFSFVTGSPLLFIQTLDVSPRIYGALFAIPTIGAMIGTSINSRLAARTRLQDRLIGVGIVAMVAADCALLFVGPDLDHAAAIGIALLACSSFGFGLIMPTIASRALEPLPNLTGFASGLLGFSQMVSGAFAGVICAALSTAVGGHAMAVTMVAFALLALAWYGYLLAGRRIAAARVA
ncbi:multidrug effflux MFS transporter [Consotaella aegiceratis]|uniref:multidrug effflux MFS transporter n=1 Tax=Consotaella aegiceratis TaxID=3097961 RepID=UPI002F401340